MPEVLHRECRAQVMLDVLDEQVQLKIDEARPVVESPILDTMRTRSVLDRLIKALDAARSVDAECPFEGDVEAQLSGPPGDRKLTWSCPLCGYEHEEVD